jgi:hypothetical protein
VPRLPTDPALTLVFLGLGVYFLALTARGLLRYRRFRRARPTALITWRTPRLAFSTALSVFGVLTLAVAVANGLLGRPALHVAGLATIALYFLLMVPLLGRIELGFYREGVVAPGGFLPYERIRRLAFFESREIVLVLVPRSGAALRLPVPAAEYGGVRRLVEEKVRSHGLSLEGMLGL